VVEGLAFWIMTPFTAEGASLKKHCCTNTRAIVYGKLLDFIYQDGNLLLDCLLFHCITPNIIVQFDNIKKGMLYFAVIMLHLISIYLKKWSGLL